MCPLIELKTFAPERVEDVVAVYNRGIVGLPYCCTLDADYFLRHIVPRFYFCPDGLILAYRRGQPLGYAHATFGPSADRRDVRRDVGTITALFFPPDESALGATLLAAVEAWLGASGARRAIGWGSGATGYPFYRGLLGGLEPVLLEDDRATLEVLRASGYTPYVESYLLATTFSEPFAEVMTRIPIEAVIRPRVFDGRWDADSWRGHEPVECRATQGEVDAGALLFAEMPRLSQQMGIGIGGIAALGVAEECRRQGIAAMLTARSLNHLFRRGVRRCLVACHRTNVPAIATYKKIGFQHAALMVGLEKSLGN
jgi:GNAT superfamily N-acetyltransferase